MNKYMWIVLKKELKDTFRDKKTIISSILIPILIFPILALVIGSGSSDFIGEGNEAIDIAIVDEGESELYDYLDKNEMINILDVDDKDEALAGLDVKAIVKIGKNFDKSIKDGESGDIEILYDQTSMKSDVASSKLNGIINGYSQSITLKRLSELGVDPEILKPINIQMKTVSVEQEDDGMGLMILSMILPMLLAIWSAVGGLGAAVDLGAGEKERQTLEPLLTTKANRLSLLLGKYFAVVIAGLMGTIAALIGFGIASKIDPTFTGSGAILTIESIIVIALLCLGLALIFGAIELAISFYARNFKEAQTYSAPITIIAMIPAYFTMYLDGKAIPDHYFHIPVVNVIAIIKQAIVSVFNIKDILIVSGWTVIYIVVALTFTVRMFRKESVIFRN